MTKLLAGRWSTNGGTLYEQFTDPSNIGIRVNIRRAYGLDRLEVTVKARDEYDMVDRLKNHFGHRLAVYSSWMETPLSGYILQVTQVGRLQVKYIARGVGWRHDDRQINVRSESGDTLTTLINTYVTSTYIPPLTGTRSIATNNTPADSLLLPENITPGDLLQKALDYDNNGSGLIYDYYCKDEQFDGLALQGYSPTYSQRVTNSAPDWIITKGDTSSWRLSYDMQDFVTRSTVRYGQISATITGGAGGTTSFSDSGANFVNAGIVAGDYVYNRTDGSYALVETVDSATQITHTPLRGGDNDDWTASDEYAVIARSAINEHTAPTTPSDTPFRRDALLVDPNLDSATADNISELLINNSPKGAQSFTITSPTVRDGNGARWPLWEMCVQLQKRTIQIADMYPSASLFSTSSDNLTTFYITALDYDHASRALTVSVDTEDKRMDVRLRIAGITNSDAIRRGR